MIAALTLATAASGQTTKQAAAAGHDLPEGTLLRVELDRTSKLHAGAAVFGHLIDPVYRIDREVLPAGLLISGHVVDTTRIPARERIWPLLDGDVTPMRRPTIVFETLTLADGSKLAISAQASERAAALVHMKSAGRRGKFPLIAMAKAAIRTRVQQFRETYLAPGKKDRLERSVFAQLPYHPQRIWRATQFDAELSQPLQLAQTLPAAVCAETPQDQLPATTLHARLLTGISSKSAKAGETVDAVLAQPVYADGSMQRLLLPQGTHLGGSVMRAKPAKLFGRPGVLRFTLKQISVAPQDSCSGQQRARELAVNGQMTGVEGAPGDNVQLDAEGQAQAGPSPNRLLAPFALTVLLARTFGDDGSNASTGAVSGGGFGLAGRVVSLSTRNANVTTGFAFYALGKSIVRRFILRGHEVEFPRNTRFDIEVSPRAADERPLR